MNKESFLRSLQIFSLDIMLLLSNFNVVISFHLFRLYALLYLVFLIVLSLALLGAVRSSDPRKYETSKDKLRAFCEVITLVFAAFYMIIEFDQMEK